MTNTKTYTLEGCRIYENGQIMMIVGSTEGRSIVDRLNSDVPYNNPLLKGVK